jgi:hypothetical protein
MLKELFIPYLRYICLVHRYSSKYCIHIYYSCLT